MPDKKQSFTKKDVIEIIAALAIAWIFYQLLSVAAGSSVPLVSVVSESMEPVLHRGDLLFVTAENQYNVRDVVIYQDPRIPYTIVHRIISTQEQDGKTYFTIKGDNNPVPDPYPVASSEVKGKVQFAIPLLGYPRLALMAFGV